MKSSSRNGAACVVPVIRASRRRVARSCYGSPPVEDFQAALDADLAADPALGPHDFADDA